MGKIENEVKGKIPDIRQMDEYRSLAQLHHMEQEEHILNEQRKNDVVPNDLEKEMRQAFNAAAVKRIMDPYSDIVNLKTQCDSIELILFKREVVNALQKVLKE